MKKIIINVYFTTIITMTFIGLLYLPLKIWYIFVTLFAFSLIYSIVDIFVKLKKEIDETDERGDPEWNKF